MKGWQIFAHSVTLVFRNLDAALRISLVLYLVQVANQVAVFVLVPESSAGAPGMMLPELTPGAAARTLVLGMLAVVVSVWIAVAWHRYVLTEEYPEGWLPRLHGGKALAYLGRSILIAVLIVLAITVAMIPVSIIAAGAPGLAAPAGVLLVGAAAYLFFRLSVMLPAAALGRKLTLTDTWNATRGEVWTLTTLAGLVIVGSLLLQLPSMLNGNPNSIVGLVYSIVVNWFAMIIGISVLTTLYGHFVEGRPID